MDQLKQRTNHTKALFRGPDMSDAPEFLPEEEQEQLIESLRISNERANDMFKIVLQAFSVTEVVIHLAFTTYTWYRRASLAGHPSPDHENPSAAFQSISPATATLFSLISFGIGIFIIRDVSLIARDSLAVWTFVSLTPIALMFGRAEFSFELVWWLMPLLLQVVDLASLWVMKDPEEDFLQLEKSQYKLKSA
ncbi:hypothetical protein BC939DRAFT_91572 [Gamsiella multidivaricata]|uniref:uncharacterized protein n=1 Tax=Gamsiella multidivaricata TaxID=101098 RepID=UPI00221FD41A|nr:uncharacterized protein BC939DRAFT_91572 [Gamsiella multidivaricata]KAI7827519.1 hypothetical protein BC939DRAFT_91572 [Gamsiella multidivaricata]